ncbi:MAG: hypothetical protein GWP30_07250, partial [Actinobacteria bacterium]|nr:hypothetical protein [Actinomycetota bacterium]
MSVRLNYKHCIRKLVRGGLLVLTGVLFLSPDLEAASAPTPSQINQLKNMSPAQQIALARQYGIEMPEGPGVQPTYLKEPVEEAPLDQGRYEELENAIAEDETNKIEASELRRYGAYVFDDALESYTSRETALVPAGYQMGPGDVLYLQVFGKDPLDVELEVDQEGRLVIPRLGPLQVAGLSYNEVKVLIDQRVKERMLGSEVVVSMGALRKISVFLAGEVNAPGNYNISALTRVSQALYLSGGITEIGSYREIQVKRSGDTVLIFDLYDLLLRGDAKYDVTLQSGDVLFVPTASRLVTVKGEVRRPAIYEVEATETFSELISMAGGLLPTAYASQSTIKRVDPKLGYPSLINIDPSLSGMTLIDGDELIIRAASEQLFNGVQVMGAVPRPGAYEYQEGARISDFLSNSERDLNANADLEIGLIVRRVDARQNIAVIPFDLAEIIKNPEDNSDLRLMAFDKIIVLPISNVRNERVAEEGLEDGEFSKEKVEGAALESKERSRRDLLNPILEKLRQQAGKGSPPAIVTISGAVQEPGDYPLLASGSLPFLVSLAGGLKDGAYQREIEVKRINVTNDEKVFTSILKASMSNAKNNFTLQSRDTVRVNYLPNWSADESAVLEGEFVFPGTYSLRDGETLRSLIERAGGFTQDAFIEALRFNSESTKALQQDSARSLIQRYRREMASRTSTGTMSDGVKNAGDEFVDVMMESFQGRLIVDVPRLLAGDESANILVQDGDVISVPRRVETVTIAGEVYEPGTFRFNPNQDVSSYLALAAGVTDRAREKDIYIIQPNGAV